MQQNLKVPAHFLYLSDASGKTARVVTNFLEEGMGSDQQPLHPEDEVMGESKELEPEIQEEETVTEICLVQDQVPDLNDEIHEMNTPAELKIPLT